jgi:hypothetical protein
MRTADEMQAMQSHPSSEADGHAPEQHVANDAPSSPYKTFFEALEELEDNKTLYGKTSFEAEIARRRVAQARELAIAEWRNRRAA